MSQIKNIFHSSLLRSSYSKGLSLYREKKWDEALSFFQLAIEKNPESAKAHFKIGMCYFRMKKYVKAKEFIERALAIDPDQVQWTQQLNQTYRHLGYAANSAAFEEEKLLLEEIEKQPHNASLYEQLATLMNKSKVWWREIDSLERATSLDAKHATWFYRLAYAHEKMAHFDKAAINYGKGIDLRKNKTPAKWYYKLGFCYEKLGKEDYIQSYKKAISLDDTLNSKSIGIGIFHEKNDYIEEAKEAYQKTIDDGNYKNKAEIFYRLGMICDKLYLWEEAETAFSKCLKYDFNRVKVHERIGYVRERQEKYELSADSYAFAASLDPENKYLIYRWGYTLVKANKFKEACQAFYNYRIPLLDGVELKKYNDDEKTLTTTNSHISLFIQDRVKDLSKILSNDNSLVGAWYELGIAYMFLDNIACAKKALSQALFRTSNHSPKIYFALAKIYMDEGAYEHACNLFIQIRKIAAAHGCNENILENDEGFAEAAYYTEYYERLEVEDNIILYESFHGANISCNPLGMYEEIKKDKEKFNKFLHIWVVNDKTKAPSEFKKLENVCLVERGSDNYLRYLVKAKILINNNTFAPYFIKKDGQIYMNTWHGTPWKYLGRDMEGRFFEHKNFTRNILQSTFLISPNKHSSNIFINRHEVRDIYQGNLLEIGYPRIDLTLNMSKKEKERIRSDLGISEHEKVVLYAPTWRGVHGDITFEFNRLYKDLSKMASIKDTKILFKGHSLIENDISKIDGVIFPSPALDTNKLLSITDVLVTDYSSILFDFMATGRKIIMYVYDYEKYKEERGLYFDEESMPFSSCRSIDEVVKEIPRPFEKSTEYEAWQTKFCGHDNGKVSKRAWEYIFSNDINVVSTAKKSLLFYGGPFMGNGITTSYLNLLHNIDSDTYRKTVVIDAGSITKDKDRILQFQKVPDDINVIARVGRMDMSLEDRYIHGYWNRHYRLPSVNAEKIFIKSWQREFKRVFGNASFNSLIDFEGYSPFWAAVFAFQDKKDKNATNFIYQHNDKYGEFISKYPYLEADFRYYKYYDGIVSVSKPTMEINKENLSKRFGVDEQKFKWSENLQAVEEIKSKSNLDIEHQDVGLFASQHKVFLTIGRLSVEKCHSKLIHAFHKLQDPDLKLLIIGDGPLRLQLIELIHQLGEEKRIFLLGRRSNPYPYIKMSACFILPSDHEGQPMVLLEALILGKPIIATDIVGSRSVLEGRGGLLVDNSVDGIVGGMNKYLAGDINPSPFDDRAYQKDALEQFYQLVNSK